MKFLFLFGIVFLFLICNVSAFDDYFCFTKLKNNEGIPSITSSISDRLTCENGRCVCKLDSGSGYCLVCTNSSGWLAAYNQCNSDYCDPTEVISGPLDLKVIFPFDNGESVVRQRFFIEIETTRKSKIDLIDNLNNDRKNLCMHCNYFRKMLIFDEGFNDITIKSAVAGEVKQYDISFFIDTKKPRISKILPMQNEFADGEFTVNYEENNLKSVELFYGEIGDIRSVQLNNCANGKNSCSVNVDLNDYYGKKVIYWFSIKDIADNVVNSSKIRIFVDNKKPVINSVDYIANGNEYNIELNVSEDNFKKAVYFDDGGKERLFCSSLKKGVCSRRLKLDGSILIKVIDRAGNFEEKVLNF